MPLDTYSTQNRGGKGRIAATFSDNDYVTDIFLTNSLNTLLCFTNFGRVYAIKAYNIPKQSPSSKGRPIINFVKLQLQETIKTIVPVNETNSLFFVTKSGTVKRSSFKHFEKILSNGKLAIKLDEQDSLVSVFDVKENDEIVIVTENGMCIKFDASEIRDMGRTASGVRGIRLSGDDKVVSADKFRNEEHTKVIVVTKDGIGKLLRIEDVKKIRRGGKGVKCIKLKSGDRVVESLSLNDLDDVIIITKNGKMIKMDAKNISVFSRYARGVKLINLDSGDEVVSISIVKENNGY